jgi:hypothetical protein
VTNQSTNSVANEIRQKIESIIGDDWDKSNAHGVDLRKCLLITPKLVRHDNTLERKSDAEPECRYLWVVLYEDHENEAGYSIVCDSAAENFGLAMRDQSGPVFLGWYMGFWAVFDSM